MKKLTFILALVMLLGAFAGTFSVSAASGDVGITLAPEISTETSVRLRKDSNGIRFTATASAELIAELNASKVAGAITEYSFGMLICKAEDLVGIDFTAEALTAAGKIFADKTARHGLKTNEKTGDVTFTTALINL
ncbi:MAG: hypothetical protein IIW78_01535, partial [Clostridia bacterium]|nr:hypothetical protein [Clostridia bacterium]